MKSEATANQEAIQSFKAALSDYTYDDFVEGDEPYILLEESAINEASRARYEVMLEKRAQQCGVPLRTVRTILKERRGNLLPMKMGADADALFDWEGQPVELRRGKYITNGNSVCIEDRCGMETICPHPLIPSRRFINIETGTESLEISFRREYWKSIIVDKGTLASASTIINLANHGVSVTSENSREVVKYLSYIDDLNRDIIPISQMSSHLGWVGNDFVPYVDGLEYDGQGQFLQMYKTIRECGKYDRWLAAVKGIRAAGCTQTRLVMAASFASVLLQKFEALPFFVHLWSAQSGTGKTVSMEIAASVWADPVVGAYCRPLKATTVGLEQLAIFTCNLPLCLDELQTIQNKSNFDDIIYSLCEGSGKTRGAKNGGLRQSPGWKNCIITTGEMPIVGSGSKAGAMNRVIEVEVKGQTMPDPKRVHKVISSNYGFAGRRFIEALADTDTVELIMEEQQQIFEKLSEIGTDKQALSASVLLAADHAAERIIFQDGVKLTEEDILPYLRTDRDVDSGRRAHEYLMDWVAENKQSFIFDGKTDDFYGKSVFGCVQTDAGRPTEIWVIGKVFSQAMADGGFSPDSYLSWAMGEGLLQTEKGQKKLTKRIPGSGMTARCVCLSLDRKDVHGYTQVPCDDKDLPF